MGRAWTRLLTKVGLMLGLLPGMGLAAETQAPAPPNSSKSLPAMPPLPAATKSPITYFRDLLAAKPDEREKLLAGKSSDHRKVIENSLRSYEVLSPEERELRLRTMEFRYHLTTLLRTGTTNRTQWLKAVPEKDLPMVEARLQIWDRLPEEDRKEVLENERMIRVFSAVNSASGTREMPPAGTPTNQIIKLEQQLVRWQTLPEGRREQIQRNFNALFELTDAEKMKELQAVPLSDEERALMQKSLDRFQQLSPLQRSQCVRGFDKFAALSPAERRQFLISAQEWQKMKAEDRQAWRKLVTKVPQLPPLPPGYGMPPMPPKSRSATKTTLVATNGYLP